MSSTQSGKDVIYIDVDDEITTLIDHVRSARQRIVALVLPKRATVLQSVVNMKLLKRTADDAKKHLVLITTEASLLPLAGAVGVYVAKSLQSKPEVPLVMNAEAKEAEDGEEAVDMRDTADDNKLDTSRPVGDYLAPGVAASAEADADEEPIELDNDALEPEKAADKPTKAKGKKDKKLKIPDFNKFRLWALLGGLGVVALIVLWFVAYNVLPKAAITIKTDSTAVHTNADLTFDTSLTSADIASKTLPAKQQQTDKSVTQQASATGQQNNGQKASGQVTLSLTDCSKDSVTIPAGTGISAGGLTFITQNTATLNSVKVGNKCQNSQFPSFTSSVVSATAQNGGTKYNIVAGSFTVSGFSDIKGKSSQPMAGGTDNIITVLSQSDIDGAKQKLSSQDTNSIKTELKQSLQSQGLYPLDGTFVAGTPSITTDANAGDQVSNVTVTEKTQYTMLGVQQSDLKKFIASEVNKQIDPSKQSILDYGLGSASFKLQNQNGTTTLVTIDDTAVAGSNLNVNDIKKQIAGKKASDAEGVVNKYPGVTNVKVTYSPFWVSAVPKKASKITVTIEKPPLKNAQ